jgi:hypothetical protein
LARRAEIALSRSLKTRGVAQDWGNGWAFGSSEFNGSHTANCCRP